MLHKSNPLLVSLRVCQDPKGIKRGLLTILFDIFDESLKLSLSSKMPLGASYELI